MHEFSFFAFIFLCYLCYSAASDVAIDCGGSGGVSAARDGREWSGDAKPMFYDPLLLQIKGSSVAGLISYGDNPVPYGTARVSSSRFSYEFQVNPGEKILRLHFNSATYKGFRRLMDFFNVESGPFTLLGNFSVSVSAEALGVNCFVKEFRINVEENQLLSLIFYPAGSNAYAFINGIEIISVPYARSYFNPENFGVQMIGKSSTAFEIIRQVNVRKDFVSPLVSGFETWEILPKKNENNVKNATWRVSVDVGFRYLIRLYFSRIHLEKAEEIGYFKIQINEMIACTNIDAIGERDGVDSIAWHRDFMVMMNHVYKQECKRNIFIYLETSDYDFIIGRGLFQGFEVMKLTNLHNSLAALIPMSPPGNSSDGTLKKLLQIFGKKNVVAFSGIAILSLINIILSFSLKNWEYGAVDTENGPSMRAERLCRRFSLAEIQLATENFNIVHLIGRGGFGNVYKGFINKGKKIVAIKRLKSYSSQGTREFLTEIETLNEVRHVNLVSLIGYCSERREMILVYEYMPRGTLADHLHKLTLDGDNCSSLTWKQRLHICIGAARGLDYLHTGCSLMHRDIKTSNILLDVDFVPKVADFGLAKYLSKNNFCSHVSTKIKGTHGYMDPNYFRTGKLTPQSDTYSFGVLLLEVLSGRQAVDTNDQILSTWARANINQGRVNEVVASNLRDEISVESLKAFVEVAKSCLHEDPTQRPTMAKVVLQLEFALEQQERSKSHKPNEEVCQVDDIHPLSNNVSASVGIKQVTIDLSEGAQKGVPPLKGQTISRRKDGRKVTVDKPSRFWPWKVTPYKPAEKDTEVYPGQLKRFSLQELQVATDGFSNKNILWKESFSKVYEGRSADGSLVAVKRLKIEEHMFDRRDHWFQTEVEMISMAMHRNLLKLHGFCMTPTERLLVYPYMPYGSVASCLRERWTKKPRLDWPTRKRIALGSARGLSYLHDHCDLKIIHRDVKAANIFLDEELEPVVGGLGLAKLMDYEDTHLTTAVRGTKGHIAPEYLSTGNLSEKTDVFGYGVMLLELITGQRVTDLARLANDNDVMLLDWVKKQKLEMLVDVDLQNNYVKAEIEQLIQVSLLCTQSSPMDRPKMFDVVTMLEGDMLASRWDEWHKLEVLRQEVELLLHASSNWIDDIHPLNKNITASVGRKQVTVDFFDDSQKILLPLKGQNYSKDVLPKPILRKDGRKVTTDKPSGLWPWKAFWKRQESNALEVDVFRSLVKQADIESILENEDGWPLKILIGKGVGVYVYKAVLPDTGKEIAIKRIIEPFRNAQELIEENPNLLSNNLREIRSEIMDD